MRRSPIRSRSPRTPTAHGYTLVEVVVSAGLLVAVALGAAQLFGMATTANREARAATSTTILAVQKMEQLRALSWDSNEDTSTDLGVDPPGGGGRGLRPSPPNALEANVPGYVDFLDRDGTWIGSGIVPPAGTHFVRRWSIQPLPAAPDATLVLTVMVRTLERELRRQGGGAPAGRLPGDVWLVTVRTKQAP